MKLLNRSSTNNALKQQILAALPGMMQNSESMIHRAFGLSGDGQTITVFFLDDSIDESGGTLANVSYGVNSSSNETSNIELHIDMSDMTNFVAPNGNDDPFNYQL